MILPSSFFPMYRPKPLHYSISASFLNPDPKKMILL